MYPNCLFPSPLSYHSHFQVGKWYQYLVSIRSTRNVINHVQFIHSKLAHISTHMHISSCVSHVSQFHTHARYLVFLHHAQKYHIQFWKFAVIIIAFPCEIDTFNCSFAVYGPLAWNCLPKEIRLCDEIEAFKRNLKTPIFIKFVNESTLAIWFWRIILKRPRMLSAQFVALYKPM